MVISYIITICYYHMLLQSFKALHSVVLPESSVCINKTLTLYVLQIYKYKFICKNIE